MAGCSILDVGCNLQNFAQWIYSFIAPYLDPILNLISSLIQLISDVFSALIGFFISLAELGASVISFVTDMLGTLGTDPTILIIVSLILLYMGIPMFVRVWNILADFDLWGFKLPKIPM